jgi:hypothetical protein
MRDAVECSLRNSRCGPLVRGGRLGWRGHGRCSIGFFRLALYALNASSRTTLRHPIRTPHALTSSILWRSGWACSLFFLSPPLIRLHVARTFALSLNTRLHTWYWCCPCTTDKIFFGLRVDLGKRLSCSFFALHSPHCLCGDGSHGQGLEAMVGGLDGAVAWVAGLASVERRW